MGLLSLSNSFVSKFVSRQVSDHLSQLRNELQVAAVHKIGCRNAKKWQGKKGLKINFGCGSSLKQGFLNVDFSPAANLRLDLRQLIPLSDGCATFIFSEHFLEHLKYPEETLPFAKECYRLLEPNGKLYISVPGTEWPVDEYVHQKKDYLVACEKHNWHPKDCTTFMEHINFHFRQRWPGWSESDFECHRFAYDVETLQKLFRSSGFSLVEARDFDENIDSNHRKIGSIFIRAKKL